jgi:hypothetical protein
LRTARYLDERQAQGAMTTFDERERAFEIRYARDQEWQFKSSRAATACSANGRAIDGLTEAEADAYAKEVVRADFEEAGDEDVIRKLIGDLTSAGVDTDETKVREALEHKTVEARRQFIEAQS